MTFQRLACLVCVVLLTIPALAISADAETTSVQDLLDERANAVASNDLAAFMATVDPGANEAFRDAQQKSFEGLASLPLSSYSLRIHEGVEAGSALELSEPHRSDEASLPETRQFVQIDGYDDRPSIDTLWLTYVRRGESWFVASGTDGEVLGLESARSFWDAGAVTVNRSPHFIAAFRNGQGDRTAEILSTAEQAFAEFDARWAAPWSKRLPIFVPSSADETTQILETDANVADFAAFVSYRTVRDDSWTAGAPRLIAQESRLSENSAQSQLGTFVHELTHAATSTTVGPFTPMWLQEGLAEYVRNGRAFDIAPTSRGGQRELPTRSDFLSSGTRLRDAYGNSASFISFVASRYGAEAPDRIFQEVGSRRVVAGTPSYNVDQAVQAVVGESLSRLVTMWNEDRN